MDMIKIFIDTEFTELQPNTTLISLGLVSEKGDTFYAEFTDYDKSQVTDWVQKHVIDNLRLTPGNPGIIQSDENGCMHMTKRDITKTITVLLESWLEHVAGGESIHGDRVMLHGKPVLELWSDVPHYDYVLFQSLWGHAFKVPSCIYYIYYDLATVMKVKGVDPDINREELAFGSKQNIVDDACKHNALWDAKVIKMCYEKLMLE